MGQCLSSRRAETSKKKKNCGPNYGLIGLNRDRNDLFCSNVDGCLVTLACLFNKTILNIFHNFISNKIVTCSDKDPSWFNDEIQQILSKKDELFKQFINNGKLKSDFDRLQCIHSDLVETIRSSKEIFYLRLSAKLSDPSTSGKLTGQYLKPSLMVKNSL